MVGVVRAGPDAGGGVSAAEWPPKTIPPPRAVTSSVQLWLANIVASVVIGVLSVIVDGSYPLVHLQASAATPGQAHAELVGLAVGAGVVVVVVVVVVVFYALEALFVWKMRSGRRWARGVLTMLAVFSVLSNVLSLLQGGFTVVSAVVSLLLDVATTYVCHGRCATVNVDGVRITGVRVRGDTEAMSCSDGLVPRAPDIGDGATAAGDQIGYRYGAAGAEAGCLHHGVQDHDSQMTVATTRHGWASGDTRRHGIQ